MTPPIPPGQGPGQRPSTPPSQPRFARGSHVQVQMPGGGVLHGAQIERVLDERDPLSGVPCYVVVVRAPDGSLLGGGLSPESELDDDTPSPSGGA
jgi:hypothetical protein